jgi:hypothetical protein
MNMCEWVRALPNPPDAQLVPEFRMFGILGTWMEADVVAANVRNAVTQGCERVYLVDNDSPDETVQVALREGAILARLFHSDHYDERLRLLHMNDVVAEVSQAEPDRYIWWLFLDADEFSHGLGGMTLRTYLGTLDRKFRVVGARYFNHYPSGRPQYVPGRHPLDFQPQCEELAYRMCPSGHRKHPLQRFDPDGGTIECGRGFHMAECSELLYEPTRPVATHHFPFRDEALTRTRLVSLWSKNERGNSRAQPNSDATDHMLMRFRSLDAVYAQDWSLVENFIPPGASPGVSLRPWTEFVDAEDRQVHRWYGVVEDFPCGRGDEPGRGDAP